MTARSQNRSGCAARRRPPGNSDQQRLHAQRPGKQPASAPACCGSAERRGERLDPLSPPTRDAERSGGAAAGRTLPARARPGQTTAAGDEALAHSQNGQIGEARLAPARGRDRGADRRDQHEPHQAQHAIDQDDHRRQRLRPRAGRAVSRMRTTSPPMLLGRKLLKKMATRNDASRRGRGDVNVLRRRAAGAIARCWPATCCEVDGQRDQQPRRARRSGAGPQARRRPPGRRAARAARR